MSCTDVGAASRRAVLFAGLLGALVLAGCSKPTPAPKPQTITVTMADMAFQPGTIDAHVGDTVHWANKDLFEHTATAADQSFDVDLKAGANGDTVLAKAGTVKVTCRFHPGMTMLLRVADRG
jgi:plastocyanin